MGAKGVRGCSTRVAGAIYLEVPLSESGMPPEFFLQDPPIPVDMEAMGITPVGVRLIDGPDGCTHVWDYVGSDAYENVLDFIEETRRMGVSRRVSRKLEFDRLQPGSRIILIHERAYLPNYMDFYTWLHRAGEEWACPKNLAQHEPGEVPDTMCAGLWWEDVEQGTPLGSGRHVSRPFPPLVQPPEFVYNARSRPDGIQHLHQPAVFMSLPIANLAVIRDPRGGTHEQAEAVASESGLPVLLEDS